MNIAEEARAFGCYDIVELGGESTPKHLDYLDLVAPRNGNPKVDAVAEFQSTPLLYLISGDRIRKSENDKVLYLQRLLANRGEMAYLGILSPGELNVYPVNLDRSALAKCSSETIKREIPTAPLFFQSVVNGVFKLEGQFDKPDYVFRTINNLMTHSADILIKEYGLSPLDVLSFLGRALFFRFLCDRRIVRESELRSVCPGAKSPGDCFHDVESSVATCQWLDETFNGDMLPLPGDGQYRDIFTYANSKTDAQLFLHLQAILKKWEPAGASFQATIDWGDLNFAHIPIGVLSQVYENFSGIWDSQQTRQTSAYYTPKNIARFLVDEAFEGLSDKKNAKILDPSCGAGIFLVLAFRKLFAVRWEHEGRRPDTRTIQSILYTQIRGFDVSESALRLAALSLYITAIELNEAPRPPRSLRFPKPLQGVVLHNLRRPEDVGKKGFVLGSLRPDLSKELNGRFDMIVSNPPWSPLEGDNEETKKEVKALNGVFTDLACQALRGRGLAGIAEKYRNPDNNPDLPFLWVATQWAKLDGIIAMALPGRIFLKQTPAGTGAFNAILQGIEITGILNGSNLSDTAVWPGMSQPFMLFFARNRVPATNHHFHFVTPHFEKLLNDKGRIRIDYRSAQPIAATEAGKDSWLLKALAIGTSLDVELVRKLDELKSPTVKLYWQQQGLYSGLGYNRSPKQRQYDAAFMLGLPEFIPPANGGFSVDVEMLPKFSRQTAYRRTRIELYSPPLLIVRESPGSSRDLPKSWVLRRSAVFSKSYYGFSAAGSKKADIIIALLHLITHSDLYRYHVLMTSSRMGAERRTFLKGNIENFPFPADLLSEGHRRRALELSTQLETASSKPWSAIDDFIFDLYGLDEYDRRVVQDTLEVAAPFQKERVRANSPPGWNDREAFYAELRKFLAPSFELTNENVKIQEIQMGEQELFPSWYFFSVCSTSASATSTQTQQNRLISLITEEADKTGSSLVIVHEEGLLLVGIIGQYRYWTLSRARLCALDILRYHLDAFPIRRS